MTVATLDPTPLTGKSLFSQHYLEARLPDHPEWAEDPGAAFDAVRALWQRAQQLGDAWNEAQTEEEFVRPALTVLGWSYIPQVKNSRSGRVNRPDYALFPDEAARDAAYPHQGQDDAFYGRALAIAEAKYWGRPLSQKDASGRDAWKTGNNPSHQMVSYLVGTRCPWGILTNGRVWRLYSREVSSTASEYYEVNLDAIFLPLSSQERGSGGEVDAFKRFWLFFRRDAFVPDSQGRSFVRRIHEGSTTYAREISDKLKKLVFAEVMPEIAGGFVAYRREQLGVAEETAESLGQIYRASLSLLYKLLFVLYAEARGLLPIANPAYWEESLTRMAREFADKLDRRLAISDATHAARQYEGLVALFRRIDQGDPSLGVPRYDGGLFNPANPDNQFLATHKLSDRAVARAVDILVRDAGQPVDYAYISVRNLGSIYEGLLENRLEIADFRLPIADLPAADGSASAPKVWRQPAVVLVSDATRPDVSDPKSKIRNRKSSERKATGSYYTPDYIVDYIVRQTLGPVLEARQPTFEAAMARIADVRRKLAKTLDAGAVRLLRAQLEDAEAAAREAFLGIKVCDPAMGSGHFLVNAVDFLTDGIIERMQAYHDAHADVPWDWNPIRQTVDRVRREIVEELARQGISLDPARLDDTSLLTRLVMKRCIYGVDLNPMAVELAKLSLWLHSFTVGAPLSFLDHHLRWGNSLIGADVRTVEATIASTEGGQMTLWGGPFAGLLDLTAVMTEVAGRADATLADVRQSADEFAAMQRALTPYKQTLDLWVSRHFGNAAAEELLTVHGADVLPALRGERALAEQYQAAVERARALWAEKRFFHWDLEFPEVFVDLARRDWAENPGFDAVIGNPPWVDAWTESPGERKQREMIFAAWRQRGVLDAHWDMYIPFIYRALELLRDTGIQSFVLPSPFTTEQYAQAVREFILSRFDIVFFVDFGVKTVFPGVSRKVIIEGVRRSTADPDNRIAVFDATSVISGGASVSRFVPQRMWQRGWRALFRSETREEFEPILEKIERQSQSTGNHFYVNYGAQISSREKGAFDKSKLLNDVRQGNAKPCLEGKDVLRYQTTWQGLWLDYQPGIMYGPRAPELFENPKLLVSKTTGVGFRLLACLDVENYYCDQRIVIVADYRSLQGTSLQTKFAGYDRIDHPVDLSFACALFNSRLMSWFFRLQLATGNLQGEYSDVVPSSVRALPIRHIAFTTPAADRARYAEEGRRLYEQFSATGDPAPLLAFVDAHLTPLTPPPLAGEGAGGRGDVVHDLLAFLAEQMIAMNKAKQAEVKGFLAWLSREIGAPIDALSNKTKLQNYLGDYQKGEPHLTLDSLLAVLRQNRRKLTADPSARAFQERLATEHAASLAVLLPLKQRLAATDRLIDQAVYRLYGLTDDEIAIVEEHHA